MISKNFEINIKANAERVWFALWDDYNYRNWTSVFHEGSYAVSDWKEGSGIHFLIPSGSGMYSVIEENKPFQKMVFKHIGELKDFKEQPLNEETRQWSGALESYTLMEKDGETLLRAEFNSIEAHLGFFENYIPKALEKIKAAGEKLRIKVEVEINAKLEKVWDSFFNPDDVVKWNSASADWHTTSARVDLKDGGTFTYRMEAKDGSMGFDFSGRYTKVLKNQQVEYVLDDGRHVNLYFKEEKIFTRIETIFDAEHVFSPEQQKSGWQSILNNFKLFLENIN
ncbi:MAG: SRPBCC domain-containing protein [Bacteroidales bacterium]